MMCVKIYRQPPPLLVAVDLNWAKYLTDKLAVMYTEYVSIVHATGYRQAIISPTLFSRASSDEPGPE